MRGLLTAEEMVGLKTFILGVQWMNRLGLSVIESDLNPLIPQLKWMSTLGRLSGWCSLLVSGEGGQMVLAFVKWT